MRLLVLAGQSCLELMDKRMRDLHCEHIQSDEIWTFVGKKQRRVSKEDSAELGDLRHSREMTRGVLGKSDPP
jgi:hypothetical protein